MFLLCTVSNVQNSLRVYSAWANRWWNNCCELQQILGHKRMNLWHLNSWSLLGRAGCDTWSWWWQGTVLLRSGGFDLVLSILHLHAAQQSPARLLLQTQLQLYLQRTRQPCFDPLVGFQLLLTVLCFGSPFPQTQREARQDNRHSPGGGSHLPGHPPLWEVAPDLAEAAGWGADVADALLPGGWCFTQELWGKNIEFCPTCVWIAAVTGPIVAVIHFLLSDIGPERVSRVFQSLPWSVVWHPCTAQLECVPMWNNLEYKRLRLALLSSCPLQNTEPSVLLIHGYFCLSTWLHLK